MWIFGLPFSQLDANMMYALVEVAASLPTLNILIRIDNNTKKCPEKEIDVFLRTACVFILTDYTYLVTRAATGWLYQS